jgi:hypothetical protein
MDITLNYSLFEDIITTNDKISTNDTQNYIREALNIDEILNNFLENYKEFIESVKIDAVHMDTIAKEYPARKARFAIAIEKLKASLSEKKLEQKKLYSELYLKFKKEAVEKGYKSTEEHLKALIHISPEYLAISNEIIELEKKINILTACKEALDDQGRMLYLLFSNTERKLF